MADSRTPPPQIQQGITLETFVLEGMHNKPGATGTFTSLLNQLGTAVKIISARVRNAGLADVIGATGETNVQGERVQILDQYANDVLVNVLERRGHCRAVASEEMAEPLLTSTAESARYVVLFDPIDGSSNIDVGVSIGTIFAILRRPAKADATTTGNLLRPGRELAAAGYALYGSQTMLVLSTGLRDGVHAFTFDPSVGEFFLSHENVRCPERGNTYSINEGNRAAWPEGVRRWNDWLKEPGEEPHRPYAQRYVGSLVADAHRTLLKGGIFVYPPDTKNPHGKIRLLYEANPMAFLFEAAGGAATDGHKRILDIQPSSVHERTALAFGSKRDVAEFGTFAHPANHEP
jgi:fructose-1,6-bisphosphatase I